MCSHHPFARPFRAALFLIALVASLTAPLLGQTVTTLVSGLYYPSGVATDAAGNIFVAEGNGQVRKVTPAGAVSVLATGVASSPYGMACDSAGNVYVSAYASGAIYKITPAGVKSTFATVPTGNCGAAFDPAGNLYVACRSYPPVIAKVTPAGAVSTLVTLTDYPVGLACDAAGNLYVGYTNSYISKVTPAGVISQFATGFNGIYGLAVAPSGEVYGADYGTGRIYRISPSGQVTLAASGVGNPWCIAFRSGVLYIAERTTGELSALGVGIGVNFTGDAYALAATDQPGLIAGGNWTNVPGGSGSNLILNDSGGNATTARLAFSAAGAYAGFSAVSTPNAGTNTMRRGGLFGNPGALECTFTVTNIPYSNYDVYVYASGDNANTATLSLTGGATTYYYRGNGQNDAGATAQMEATSTDAANPTVGRAFYTVFRNRTGTTFTATTGGSITGVISNNIFGFQIVPTAPPPAPVITSATSATATVGNAFNYTITATNSPTSYGASTLPAGLSFNTATGVISGTPSSNGTFTIGLSATNGGGTGTATLTLTINGVPKPVITSATSATGTVGAPFSYAITATNSPSSYGASGLPANLSLNNASGLISGTPAAAGMFTIGLSATNSGGTGTGATTLTIAKGAAGVSLQNLTQTYDGAAKSVGVTTTPAGLAVNVTYNGSATAPTNAGSYTVVATITNPNYNGGASGTLTVTPAAATVTLGNLTQGFDGAPKAASVTTVPAGLATSVTYNGSATAPTAIGSYTVNASITNPNYTGTASGTLTITDTVKPVLTLPASPIVAEATSAAGAAVSFTVSATDNVDGAVTATPSVASGSTFALGSTTVTVTAQDAAGNVATDTFVVTVQDTTAPVLTVPANQTLEATSAAGAVASFTASATDAVGATVEYSHASGGTFALGVTTIAVTAKDAAGNTSSGTFTITVQDTTTPVLTLPASLTLEATSAAGATGTFAAAANDLVSGAVAVTLSHNSGSTFPLGTTTVTASAADAAGNTATGSFTVLVRDTTAPVLTLPASLTVEATSANGATATFAATATDAVGATVSYSHASGGTFALGTTTVTVTAQDAANNTTSGTFTVTVQDTIAPVLTVPANIVVEATSGAGATVSFAVSATDAVGATIATSQASGSVFPLGTTTVTVTAKDAANNTTVRTFDVTVRDTIAPSFTSLTASSTSLWPANHKLVAITLSAAASDTVSAVATRIVSATSSEPDNGLGDGDTAGDIAITGAMTLNLRAERSGTGSGRVYTITVEARDASDNVTTRTVTVSVPKSQGGK